MSKRIVFTFKDEAGEQLVERSRKLVPTAAPFKLAGVNLSMQFLRGVFSRASLCLPAYYLFLGSASAKEAAASDSDYPSRVAQSYAEFADLNTLTLSCRKIFDDARKPDLTGANFAKLSDSVLEQHAAHWAKGALRPQEDAYRAVQFLRRFFAVCSQSDRQLLQTDSQLQKRIGLLKQHANRAAAHLTLEDYSLDIVDLTHFVAAAVVVAEIIRSFDMPQVGPNYFERLDAAAYSAARRVFPHIAEFQIFARWKIEQQARLYWQMDQDHGIHMLLNQIQHAVGGAPRGDA